MMIGCRHCPLARRGKVLNIEKCISYRTDNHKLPQTSDNEKQLLCGECWQDCDRTSVTNTVVDELEEYFKLEPEDFDLCNLIHWQMTRVIELSSPTYSGLPVIYYPWHRHYDKPSFFSVHQVQLLPLSRCSQGVVTLFPPDHASLHLKTSRILMLVKKKVASCMCPGCCSFAPLEFQCLVYFCT